MPALNDLTAEEQAEFARMGDPVTPPAGGGNGTLPPEDEGVVVEQPGHGDRTGEEGGQHGDRQPVRDPATGRFTSPGEEQPQDGQQQQPQDGQQQQPQDGQQQPPPGFVPHQALHEARQQAAQVRQQMAQLQARTNAILAAQAQAQELQPLPNIEEDPRAFVEQLGERLTNFEAVRAEEARNAQIDNALAQDEQLFVQYTPDYEQASEYFVLSRARELAMFYPPQQIQKMMAAEARQVAQQAWQQGRPAAELFYQMAQMRGYQLQAARPEPLQVNLPPQTGGQGQQQPVDGQPQQQNGGQRVAQIKQAQQGATRTLSNTGGGAATQLNAEALLAMSDEDFEAYLKLGHKGANQRFQNVL